jgi:hypothetical protein
VIENARLALDRNFARRSNNRQNNRPPIELTRFRRQISLFSGFFAAVL